MKQRTAGFFAICLLCTAALIWMGWYTPAPQAVLKATDTAAPETADTAASGVDDALWQTVEMTQQDLRRGDLILVNNDTAYAPSQAEDLVRVYEQKNDAYYVKDRELSLRQEILPALNDWCAAAKAATGADNANVVAGYRTVEYQQQLYDNAVQTHGKDYAEQYLAHPGYSEHHTGLALDFSLYLPQSGLSEEFDGNRELSTWMLEHAWEYGFVQRYPEGKQDITGIAFESWHFRYVGRPHAWYMAQNDLCLEEYLQLLRNYPQQGEHLYFLCDGTRYEVYFCRGRTCVVPRDADYTLSGNNVDGFIVTVARG